MTNGFIYIKELLMQNHNWFMYESICKLKTNKIKVYNVKTDSFVIDGINKEKVNKLLKFGDNFGEWRFSKDKNIIFSPQFYKKKMRTRLLF